MKKARKTEEIEKKLEEIKRGSASDKTAPQKKGTEEDYRPVLDAYFEFVSAFKNGEFQYAEADDHTNEYVREGCAYSVAMNLDPEIGTEDTIEYALKDLDGNGVNELIIGGDIFSLNKNGEPVSLFEDYGLYFGYRVEGRIAKNGSIVFIGSSGANSNTIEEYKIDNSGYGISLENELIQDDYEGTISREYNGEPISKDEFNRRFQEYYNITEMKLDWKELNQ